MSLTKMSMLLLMSLFGVVDHPGAAVLEHEGGCGAVPEDFPGGAGAQAERLGVGEGFAGDGDVYSAELEHGAASPVAVEHRFGLPGGCDHEHQHIGIGGRVADRGSRLDAVRRQGHGLLSMSMSMSMSMAVTGWPALAT